MSSVLDREALSESPLADLHIIASELGLDGFRRLRKADLVDAILERQDGGGTPPAPAPEPRTADPDADPADDDDQPQRRRRTRGGRGRRRNADPGDEATSDDAGPDAPPARGAAGPAPPPAP